MWYRKNCSGTEAARLITRMTAAGMLICSVAVMAQTADVLSRLGITPQAAKQAIDSVINSGVYNPALPASAFRRKAARADRTRQYEQELATWKRDFPESAAPVIAKRLREFLAASADVDFAAKLTFRTGKMVFENQAYEQKPGQWKMCYRAGKEATTAARTAAQAWLKELRG